MVKIHGVFVLVLLNLVVNKVEVVCQLLEETLPVFFYFIIIERVLFCSEGRTRF